MKKFQRIISGALVFAMMFCICAVSAIAVQDYSKVNIIINDGNANAGIMLLDTGDDDGGETATTNQYDGYKLMTASVSDNGSGGLNAVYTVNSQYSSILRTALNVTSDAEVISTLQGKQDVELQAIADKIYRAILATGDDDTPIKPDATTTNGVFSQVDTGYWLIAGNYSEGNTTPKTLVIVDTVSKDENFEITPKDTDVPTVDKDVKEGEVWQDYADAAIGDTVDFRLTGTIPDKGFSSYETYSYKFTDTLSKGLTLNIDSVTVYAVTTSDGNKKKTLIPASYTADENNTKINYTATSVDVAEEITGTYAGGKILTISFDDLKSILDSNGNPISLTSAYSIVVEYTADLNSEAVVEAAGNPNKVQLEYSNDPYTDSKGTTEEKTVKVFTYKVIVNKTDDEQNPLTGAEFTLYKEVAADGSADEEDGAADGDGDTIDAGYTTIGEKQYTAISAAKNDEGTEFTFSGLDAGNYILRETTTPAGYNTAADVSFTITPVIGTNTEDGTPVITSITTENTSVTGVQGNAAAVTTTVVNNAGTELPGTGGMGRTLIYVFGTICVLGAGVLLVTKRRMRTR